jgi:hypothetical protein
MSPKQRLPTSLYFTGVSRKELLLATPVTQMQAGGGLVFLYVPSMPAHVRERLVPSASKWSQLPSWHLHPLPTALLTPARTPDTPGARRSPTTHRRKDLTPYVVKSAIPASAAGSLFFE